MKHPTTKLNQDFFFQTEVTEIARELLGKVLITDFRGKKTAGIITETEAYAGSTDRASHAFNNRRTARTEVMYKQGGVAYIYLCYGIHHLFNFVTGPEEIPHAVLLRGIYPLEGIAIMEERRGMSFKGKGFSDGPGKVTASMGLSIRQNGFEIGGKNIWVEDRGIKPREDAILTGPRIGVDYAGNDAHLPYRYLFQYQQA